MNNTDIGIATMTYNIDGSVKTAQFDALTTIDAGHELINQLATITGNVEEEIVQNAQTLMASWFMQINQIEIADRTQYEIAHEVLRCDKYDTGNPKDVVIRFYFKPL